MSAETSSKDAKVTITAAPRADRQTPRLNHGEEPAREYQYELGVEVIPPEIDGAERALGHEARVRHEAPRDPELSPFEELPRALKERFEAVTLIGEGGAGRVYKARDRKLGREVAIKLIAAADGATGWRFLQEVRAQARIEHPHVCEIFEVGSQGGLRFIVMQLVHGEPLSKAKEGMTTEQKVKAIKEAADALHEAHRVGFIHRDIKPSNIMVERGEDGAYKPSVMDFGLARELEAWSQTVTGAVSGTPAFMAPEQARGVSPDPAHGQPREGEIYV